MDAAYLQVNLAFVNMPIKNLLKIVVEIIIILKHPSL